MLSDGASDRKRVTVVNLLREKYVKILTNELFTIDQDGYQGMNLKDQPTERMQTLTGKAMCPEAHFRGNFIYPSICETYH